jgi:cholesterol oxidase
MKYPSKTPTPEHFDAVIVGSGFGGSAVACRLAQAGWRVCVLERGKPFPPGSFPRTPNGMSRNFWDPSEGKYGMFDVWSFRGLEALVSSGLGGGSLIYANVLLRKDEKWFVHDRDRGGYETWPVTRADLDPYYDRAEEMLQIARYPFDVEPYASTPKTRAMQAAAREQGLEWMLPPLAVTFANPGESPVPGAPLREALPNLHGAHRATCTLCGECDVGCNEGSKNSLDYTYLSEAKRHGADIRTLCEVRTFSRRPSGGFIVTYVKHDLEREGKKMDSESFPKTLISADRLVLAAGTLGTTYLMLRNRTAISGVSSLLGTRFSGNGDLLSFAVACRETKEGVDCGRSLEPSRGPVITSAIRYPDALDRMNGNGERGMYIEDAGYPAFLGWIAETSNSAGVMKRMLRFAWQRVRAKISRDAESDLSAEIAATLGDCRLSNDSLPLLGMGRDTPDGVMDIRDGWLDIDWTTRGSKKYFERMRGAMESITHSWGGTFVDNPIWYLNRVITVHPLGGCPMGHHLGEGVVDSYGNVFNVPGLSIVDGSVMPGPVGANPSLTIAAIAERSAEHMIEAGR